MQTSTVLHVGLGALRRLRCAQGAGGEVGRPSGGEGDGERAAVSLGGSRKGTETFPPSPLLNVGVFRPQCWLGSSPEREKREAGLPGTAPNPVALRESCVDGCVCAEGEARPRPRTTHNSVHSRLSFVPSLLPEEASAMAGAERGWALERRWLRVRAPRSQQPPWGRPRQDGPLGPGQRLSAPAGSARPLLGVCPLQRGGQLAGQRPPPPPVPPVQGSQEQRRLPSGCRPGPGPA